MIRYNRDNGYKGNHNSRDNCRIDTCSTVRTEGAEYWYDHKIQFLSWDIQQAAVLLCFPNGTATLTPANYRRYAERVETIVGVPVVFILEAATYINRSRLIEQGVYFVVSRKYAFLPTLLVNAIEKSRGPKRTDFCHRWRSIFCCTICNHRCMGAVP